MPSRKSNLSSRARTQPSRDAGAQRGRDDDDEEDVGEGGEDLAYPHDERVNPLAVVAGDEPEAHPDQQASGEHGDEREDHRVLDPPQHPGEEVAAGPVRAGEVGLRPECQGPLVEDVAGGLADDRVVLSCVVVGGHPCREDASEVDDRQYHDAGYGDLLAHQAGHGARQVTLAALGPLLLGYGRKLLYCHGPPTGTVSAGR